MGETEGFCVRLWARGGVVVPAVDGVQVAFAFLLDERKAFLFSAEAEVQTWNKIACGIVDLSLAGAQLVYFEGTPQAFFDAGFGASFGEILA